MTKRLFISFAAFALSSFLSLCVLHLSLLWGLNKWIYLIFSAALAISAVILLVIFYKRGPLLYIIPLNSLSVGLAMAAIYAHMDILPPAWKSAAVLGAAAALYLLFILCLYAPVLKRRPAAFLMVFATLAGAGILIGGIVTKDFVFALSAFVYAYAVGFLIAAVITSKDRKSFSQKLVCASFIIAFIAVCVALIVLSEGEALDGIAPDAPRNGKKKNVRRGT